MIEPWNDAQLQPPPVNTCFGDKNSDAKDLRHICSNMVLVLSRQSPLHKEGAVFSRLVYKYDKKFRHDIGYRYFKKVNIALKKYLSINVLKDIENFAAVLPEKKNENLPTRQMLEYILVRLMTLSKIMLRICVCAKQAAIYYFNKVKDGEAHWMSLMPFALLSRVWSLCLVLLKHTIRWYNSLYAHLNKLRIKGLSFLPEGYSLPINLELWLDMKNMDCFGSFQWSQKQRIDINLSLDEDNEIDTFESILNYVNEIGKDNQELDDVRSTLNEFRETEQLMEIDEIRIDQGEAISREIFCKLLNSHTKLESVVYNHNIDNIKDVSSLEVFLEKEESYRNEDNTKSLTSHLSFMQWEALKKALNHLCNTTKVKTIEKKIKRIWKEKCDDYNC